MTRSRTVPNRSTCRTVGAAVMVACVAVLVPGCGSGSKPGGGGGGATSTATAKTVTVAVKNFAFTPKDLEVAVGTKVTWKFEDSAQHTVDADNGKFRSRALHDGQTYTYTFSTPGTYGYICSIHQYMTAKIVVSPRGS